MGSRSFLSLFCVCTPNSLSFGAKAQTCFMRTETGGWKPCLLKGQSQTAVVSQHSIHKVCVLLKQQCVIYAALVSFSLTTRCYVYFYFKFYFIALNTSLSPWLGPLRPEGLPRTCYFFYFFFWKKEVLTPSHKAKSHASLPCSYTINLIIFYRFPALVFFFCHWVIITSFLWWIGNNVCVVK